MSDCVGQRGRPNPARDTETDGRCAGEDLLVEHAHARLTAETHERITRLLDAEATPFANRGEVIRAALTEGLDALDARYLDGGDDEQ